MLRLFLIIFRLLLFWGSQWALTKIEFLSVACICDCRRLTFKLMESSTEIKPGKGQIANSTPTLELHLSRDVFVTGKRLSGVVALRLDQGVNLRSLVVSLDGSERPRGIGLARAFRKAHSFFNREKLLTGALEPRLASERLSLLWNAVLGRYTGRTLSAGEHIYPFSISLPASLPPSYEGKAGKIRYRVTAKFQPAIGRAIKVSKVVEVMFMPRLHRGRPMALGYPEADGTVQPIDIKASIELVERMVGMGEAVQGSFSISNPKGAAIPRVTVSLEVCEWVRLTVDKEIQRDRVDMAVIVPEDPSAMLIEAPFKLRLPKTAPPTIEGSAISVIWLLKLTLDTDPTIEVKTPITVYIGCTQ